MILPHLSSFSPYFFLRKYVCKKEKEDKGYGTSERGKKVRKTYNKLEKRNCLENDTSL